MVGDLTTVYWGLGFLVVVLIVLGLVAWDDYRTTQYRRAQDRRDQESNGG